MRWERIQLYIEHLFPGLLVLFLTMAFLGDSISGAALTPRMRQLLKSEFAAVSIFFSASYVVGVVAALISRMLIDWLSDFTFSYWFFRAVAIRLIHRNRRND